MEKMQKTARVLDAVMKVLQILMIVSAAVMLAADIGFLIRGGNAGGMTQTLANFALSMNGVLIAPECAESISVDFVPLWWGVSVKGIFVIAVVWCGLIIVRRILRPMKEGRPFEKSVSRDLNRLGWFVIGGGDLTGVLHLLIQNVLMRSIFSNAGSVTVGVQRKLDLTFLVYAAILFLLSYIFRYGEELQRQSDETL